VCVYCSKGFHHGISSMNKLYFNHSKPCYYSSLPFPPSPYYLIVFSIFQCAFFLHRCNVFQHYPLYHSLFLSLLPLVSSNSPTWKHVISLYIYVTYICTYIIMFVFMYMFIFWIYHICEKTCNLGLSEPGLLCLT
jgi:hypothetical protein